MIDLSAETVVSLTQATHHLPRRRRGKRPNPATIYRWAQRGVHGIVLETIQVGGTKCTSVEALQRFCNRLTDPDASVSVESPTARSRRREKQKDDAERLCEQAGI